MKKIIKSKAEWKKILDTNTYQVTRESGTETPFSGKYVKEKTKGIYSCICCNTPLFSSDTKFDSNSGWPSFYQVIKNDCITQIQDISHGMNRTEVLCASCDSHLGHLFKDGPEPTGLRYCINSLSLKLIKNEK